MQRILGPLLSLTIACSPSVALARSKAKKTPPVAPEAQAGELVPADTEAALFLESAQAASGLVALLAAAARPAPSLSPSLVSQDLTRALGVDPFGDEATAKLSGLSPDGPRAIVLDPRALAFTAPVADEALAKHALQIWLGQLGPVRQTRQAPLKGPLASGGGDQVRAGMIAPVAGGMRLITASGRGAAALVSQLAHVGHKAQDNAPLGSSATLAAALLAVPGPVRLWIRGDAPVLGTLASLEGSNSGLVAHGLLLPVPGAAALLEGAAPPDLACQSSTGSSGSPIFCARLAPGPGLRALAPLLVREMLGRDLLGRGRDALDALLQGALAASRGPALLRIESIDARALGEPEQLLAALPSSIASGVATDAGSPNSSAANSSTPTATASASATSASAIDAGASDAGPSAVAAAAPVAPNEPGLIFPAQLPPQWFFLPPPQSGVMLSSQPQLCLQSQAGALWLSSPCSPAPLHLNETGGATEIVAHLDTRALAQSLRPLSALDALRGSLAAGAFAGKILWGDLLLHSGPVEFSARLTAQASASLAGALDLTLAWPLSTEAGAK